MQIIKNPSLDTFLSLVSSSKNTIRITSPFIKENIVTSLLETKKEKTKVVLITSFKLMNYYTGASDLNALQKVLENKGTVNNFQKLHSKIYIFDDEQALITSGNLTTGGLINNFEYGILIDENKYIDDVIKDFNLLLNHELTGKISMSEIGQAKEIISKATKTEPLVFPNIQYKEKLEEIEIFTGGVESVISSLNGWKLEVFKCLLQISNFEFDLSDVNKFISILQKKFPNNNNIEAKIRQQLQILRDIGLVEFLGNGHYRKLWF